MDVTGIVLGGCVAVLWGTADSMAALSTRHLTVFATTFISRFSALIILSVLFVFIAYFAPSQSFSIPPGSIFIGICTGIASFIGSFALYQALRIGPVAITAPLSSTGALITLLISIIFLGERLTIFGASVVLLIIVGILLASSDLQKLNHLFTKKSFTLLTGKGVRWALITPIAFGLVDIGIGVSSPQHGYFAPVFLNFLCSTLILSVFAFWQHSTRKGLIYLVFAVSQLRHKINWLLLATGAGILECAAIIVYGIATQSFKPGVMAAIASNYSLVAILCGTFILHERLLIHQKVGIGMVLTGLTLLAFLRI